MNMTHKLLLAASDLEAIGSPWTTQALVEAAWKRDKQTFGMKGYELLYPSDNRVMAAMSGKKGVVARGWLEQTGTGEYKLAREGRLEIERANGLLPAMPAQIGGFAGRLFAAMLDSHAARKFSEGQRDAVTFADALAFWGIRFPGDIAPRFEIVDRILRELEAALEDGSTRQAARRTVAIGDVLNVANVNRWLQGRFAGRLDAMQARERKKVTA